MWSYPTPQLETTPNHPHAPAFPPVKNSSRSIESGEPGGSPSPLLLTQPGAPIEVPLDHTPQFSGPVWTMKVTELPQDFYNRQQFGQSTGPLPLISFGPYGFSVSSALEIKNRDLRELARYDQIAFKDHEFGQKLSWRFLFKGFPKFEKQFNVLGAAKTQPTVQRMVVETAKALRCFNDRHPQFPYDLHQLVILEIELVSHASVQAKIGVMEFELVNQD